MLRVSDTGELWAEGPITAHRATVSRAAQLLEDLIAPADAAPEFRAPGPMRLALLRARGAVDLPPFPGLVAFAVAVARFAPDDRTTALRELYQRWQNAAPQSAESESTAIVPAERAAVVPVRAATPEERELTISDIRRARRATGMSLHDVAERSRIPPALLRELEWGYLWNWPGGLYGRTQLVRYARAAGLDERVVVEVTWPMLQAVVDARGGDAVRLIPAEESIEILLPSSDPLNDVAILRTVDAEAETPRRRRGGYALAAAAAAALILSPGAFWLHSRSQMPPSGSAAQTTQVADAAPNRTAVAAESALRRKPSGPASLPARETASPKATTGRSVERDNGSDGAADSSARAVPASDTYSPAFSNEGTAVFFREEDGGHSALVRADSASRGNVLKIMRVLDDNARNFHARPSPDGSEIAFDSDREGIRAVFVADQNGRNVHRVSGEGFAAVPSWSPDGRRLAFVKAEPNDPQVWNLWIADVGTGAQRQLTFNTHGQPWGGSWFPDGRRIAYSKDDSLAVYDLDAGSSQTYSSPVENRSLGTPAVSPDGRHIIFQVARDGAWLLNLTNGNMRKVLDDPTAEEYTWAPDGRRVAFHSQRSGGWGVWIMGG